MTTGLITVALIDGEDVSIGEFSGMKPLRCDFCGGQLIMDNSREFAVCEFCGTKYMKEIIQDKIQEIRGQVSITGAVETVTGDAEKERLLKNAETYIGIREFDKAIQTYQQVIKQFPEDYRGWWGLYTTPVERYFFTGVFLEADKNALRNTYNLCQDKNTIVAYFDTVMKKYGHSLKLITPADSVNLILAKTTVVPPTPDSFTTWLLFQQGHNLNFFPNNFKSFIANLSAQYIDGAKSGSVYAPLHHWYPLLCQENLYIDVSSISMNSIVNLVAITNGARYSMAPITPGTTAPCFYKIGWGNTYADVTKINGFFGRWIYTKNINGKDVTVLSSRVINIQMLYRFMGRCQHCGGVFSGIFKHVCKECGTPKDY